MYKPLSEAIRDENVRLNTAPFQTVDLFNHQFNVFGMIKEGYYFQCKKDLPYFPEEGENYFHDLETSFTPYIFIHTSFVKTHYFNSGLESILGSVTLR